MHSLGLALFLDVFGAGGFTHRAPVVPHGVSGIEGLGSVFFMVPYADLYCFGGIEVMEVADVGCLRLRL